MSSTKTAPRFVWHDLNTTDPARARAFYGELFGWNFEEMNLPSLGAYTMLLGNSKEDQLGGIAASEGAPSHWLPYVGVDDLEAAVARAPKLGGRVLVPVTEIPDIGHFAVVQDPTGAQLALYKSGASPK